MSRRQECIWVSWQRHRRTDSLIAYMGVPLYVMTSRQSRIIKHPLFAMRTLVLLLNSRPRVLIVQNPSIALTTLAAFAKLVFRYRLVVDAHNAGVYIHERQHSLLNWIFRKLHQAADITIVTNQILADIVESNGGRPFVLPDPLPVLEYAGSEAGGTTGAGFFVVTVVCTFASDEPYLAVFEAAKLLPEDVQVRITGDPSRIEESITPALDSDRLVLLGYLPEAQYVDALATSDIVIDLTTRQDCLVCGAYESVALGVPLILSDTPVSRQYFTRGVVYTKNTAEGIAEAVLHARANLPALQSAIRSFREEVQIAWEEKYREFRDSLSRFLLL